jgi:hypothetical protein
MKKTFKDAVEKAVENGFDINKLFSWTLFESMSGKWTFSKAGDKINYTNSKLPMKEIGIWFNGSIASLESVKYINIYYLIFGTDFVDKLIINNKNPLRPIELDTTVCMNYKCEDNTYDLPNKYCRNCQSVTIDRLLESCPRSIKGSAAAYHKQQMALIATDIDKLKEYVISLI